VSFAAITLCVASQRVFVVVVVVYLVIGSVRRLVDTPSYRLGFPAGAGNFSLHHRFQNGSGAHPTSYPMATRGSFSWK
jgi:hypothetical protein